MAFFLYMVFNGFNMTLASSALSSVIPPSFWAFFVTLTRCAPSFMNALLTQNATDDIATQVFKKAAYNVFLAPQSEEYISQSKWLYARLSDHDARSKELTQRTCEQVKQPKSLLLTFTFIDEEVACGALTPEQAEQKKIEYIQKARNLRVKFKPEEFPTACEYWNCLSKRLGTIAPERCSLIMIPSSPSLIKIARLIKDFFSNQHNSYPDLLLLCRENNWQKTALASSIYVYNNVELVDQKAPEKKVSYQLVGVSYCKKNIGSYESQFFHKNQWYLFNCEQSPNAVPSSFLDQGKCMSYLECCVYKKHLS